MNSVAVIQQSRQLVKHIDDHRNAEPRAAVYLT